MNETPRTDALILVHLSPRSKWLGLGHESYREAGVRQVGALIELARQLEREVDALKHDIERHLAICSWQATELTQASKSAFANAVRAETTETKLTQAQARCAEVEKENAELREALIELVRIDDESAAGLLTDANTSSDLVLAMDQAYKALKEPR